MSTGSTRAVATVAYNIGNLSVHHIIQCIDSLDGLFL